MRADVYLTQNGFAESRNKASRLIEQGLVTVDGQNVKKVSEDIDEAIPHKIEIKEHDSFVGRGAIKLISAIKEFEINVENKRCIDVGASTGGFTQTLLMCGASHVTAVDSGRGQLHKSLLDDVRVRSVEGYNARNLNCAEFGVFECAVMDVSFISQTLIIPALSGVMCEGGVFISLIKPQFEAGRSAIGKNGIVKNSKDREASMLRVLECASACGFSLENIMRSPITGGDGNTEYLACFVKNGLCVNDTSIKEKINRLSRE